MPDARAVLDRLSDDRTLSVEERRYYAELQRALDNVPDSGTIGHALDDVDCPLRER